MPEISRFFGIVIKMFVVDHNPPHFHAYYAENEVLVNINTLTIFTGKFPPRAVGLVMEWATLHQDELLDNWSRVQKHQSVKKIGPLQ